MNAPTLEDWVWVEAMLVQALIGAISENFRQVALCYRGKSWCLDIVLEIDNQEDREEIADIADQLGVLLDDVRDRISASAYARVLSEIHVTNRALNFTQSEDQRLVFRRKESRNTV